LRRVLLIFIDGFGLGQNDKAINPLVKFDPPLFRQLFGVPLTLTAAPVLTDRVCMVATDTALGVSGLPQSATGQTALFTGINAPKVMDRHIQGFPGPGLAKIIAEHSLLSELAERGLAVTSANAYSPNYMDLVAARKRRHSVTTLTMLNANLALRSLPELQAGQAVNQDITNEMLPLMGITTIEPVSAAVAGNRLAKLAKQNHFTMFEYFQTDRWGHKRDWDIAKKIITVLNEFLTAVYAESQDELLVMITSDHGNFEDFSVKTHTNNLVPTIIWGPACCSVAAKIKALTDIKPAITTYLS